ncbi:cytochrome P450 [Kitasatospora misakiensis]|uniref:Cytochrome P450 n=1 Tax=Kitasatospora misakiensis TaxID=67330 RepID=A0ABW0X844_9ACTN
MENPVSVGRAPGALPLIGHLLPLLRDPLGFVSSLPAHGDLVHIRLGPMPALTVCTPELTRQILLDDSTFDKGGPFYDRLREAVGNGLASCPHTAHRRQRRLVQPAFHRSRLASYTSVTTAEAVSVTGSWQDGLTTDVYLQMRNITTRSLIRAMFREFSEDLDSAALTEMADDVQMILVGMFARMVRPRLLNALPTPGGRRFRQARGRLYRTTARIISKRRSGGDGDGHDDLLSVLLNAVPPDGDRSQQLTDAEINDQLAIFIVAGIEATAATLAWALHLLALNPSVEQRLHAEVDRVLAGAAATHGHLSMLPYTSRVITETLRMYPPGWLFTRIATRDTHVGGHPVSAGTTVIYSPYLIHHQPDQYAEPERFDPDRWEDRPHPSHPAFFPFGGGARKCIGDQFSMAEAVVALATIAARWRLEPLAGQRVRPFAATALRPAGLHMRFRARELPTAP